MGETADGKPVSVSGETMITVTDLTKRYGEIEALKGVSFSIRKGEIVGFLGPNGAGKSTCLKIITGFLPPTSGRVVIGGLDVAENPVEVRKKLGYMPENAPLYYDMIVYDYLNYVAALRGVGSAKRKKQILEMSERCGVSEVLHQVVGTLSKGYRQRVCLAQALLHEPEILILDEPTVGLDPNQVVEVRQLIKELGKDRTVILSTHILPEVLSTCDRMLIIHNGKMVADGTAEELQRAQAENPPLLLTISSHDGQVTHEAVISALKENPWVVDARRKQTGIQGELTFEIIPQKGTDIREKVVDLMYSRGWKMLELKTELLDLEGIFRKLTQD